MATNEELIGRTDINDLEAILSITNSVKSLVISTAGPRTRRWSIDGIPVAKVSA